MEKKKFSKPIGNAKKRAPIPKISAADAKLLRKQKAREDAQEKELEEERRATSAVQKLRTATSDRHFEAFDDEDEESEEDEQLVHGKVEDSEGGDLGDNSFGEEEDESGEDGYSDGEEEQDFEGIDEGDEESDAEDDQDLGEEEEEADEPADETQDDRVFAIGSTYFEAIGRDFKQFSGRLGQLNLLLKHPGLSKEGKQFTDCFVQSIKGYLAHICFYLSLCGKVETEGLKLPGDTHPVLRRLAELRESVKNMDKVWKSKRGAVVSWLEQNQRSNSKGGVEHGAMMEEDLDELDGEEEFEDEFGDMDEEAIEEDDSQDSPAVKHSTSVPPRSKSAENRKLATKAGSATAPQKLKVQNKLPKGKVSLKFETFNLAQPKTFLDIHKFSSLGEDYNEDEPLNLGKRSGANQGEITLEDVMRMEGGVLDDPFSAKKKGKDKEKKKQQGLKLYEQLAEEKEQSRSLQKALREAVDEEADKYEKKLMYTERRVKGDEPRTLSQDILHNKGLQRKREKEISKVKLRRKFEEAKRKNNVRLGIRQNDAADREKEMREGYIRGVGMFKRAVKL